MCLSLVWGRYTAGGGPDSPALRTGSDGLKCFCGYPTLPVLPDLPCLICKVIKKLKKIEMKRIDAIKRGGNKESSYITHHNCQSDSTFLIEFGQGL